MHRVDLCHKAFYWTIKSKLNTQLLDLGRNEGLEPETLFRWDEPVLVAVALLDNRTRYDSNQTFLHDPISIKTDRGSAAADDKVVVVVVVVVAVVVAVAG